MSVQKLPMWKKIMYALGQFGWSLVSFAPGMVLVYFYMPPKTGAATFPPRIYQGYVLGVLTLIGLAYAAGRLFDAITDPLIAGYSDRSKSKFGRRRKFLAISVLPFALLSFLVFLPPVQGSSIINSIWVFSILIIFYWFMTMYVTPYFALLSELGHNPNERLLLSTLISITWALGAAVGSQVYTFKNIFQSMGYDPTKSFQIVMAIFAIVGFLLMLLPIIFIDEQKYCEHNISKEGIFESLRSAFKNKNFLYFTLSDLAYWAAMAIITTGLVYYVTILLRLQESVTSQLQLMMFALSFLFYIPINFITKKVGKKPMLIFGFGAFIAAYLFTVFLGFYPLHDSQKDSIYKTPIYQATNNNFYPIQWQNYNSSKLKVHSVTLNEGLKDKDDKVIKVLKENEDYTLIKPKNVYGAIINKDLTLASTKGLKANYKMKTSKDSAVVNKTIVVKPEEFKLFCYIELDGLNGSIIKVNSVNIKNEKLIQEKDFSTGLLYGKFTLFFKKNTIKSFNNKITVKYNYRDNNSKKIIENTVTVFASSIKGYFKIKDPINLYLGTNKIIIDPQGKKNTIDSGIQEYKNYGKYGIKFTKVPKSFIGKQLKVKYDYSSNLPQGYLLMLLAAIPLAIFGILPNAIVADIAEADGIETGNFKAGIFFGARTFMQKMGQMVGGLLFPSVMILGDIPGFDKGIRYTAIVAIIFLVMGLILFIRYNERAVLKSLAKKEELSPEELAEIQDKMST